MRVLLCFLCALAVPVAATATAASSGIFPSLRKRRQQQLAAVQTQAKISQIPQPDFAGPTLTAGSEAVDAPAEVPTPIDAGSDGYPQLPAVSQMLSGASGTLKTVGSQASGLEAHVVQAQMQIESKMARQKAAFEEKLKQQEEKNRMIIDANANITAEINGLKRSNIDLRKHAHEVERSSQVMRSQLHTLQSRFGDAKEFTIKSLHSTDDSENALVQVLHSSPHMHRNLLTQTSSNSSRDADDDDDEDSDNVDDSNGSDEDSDDKDDDHGDEEEGASFLSLATRVHRSFVAPDSTDDAASSLSAMSAMTDFESSGPAAHDSMSAAMGSSPGDLLEGLSKEVAQLAEQERESEKSLKQLFIRDFRAGAKRKLALLAQQKALVASRNSLTTLQGKLKSADDHLEVTRKHLEARLQGLGRFLQRLGHLAMAPPAEVPSLMKALPKTVTLEAKH